MAADAVRTLDELRLLRPTVIASGDRSAMIDYNSAVKKLKRTIALSRSLPVDYIAPSAAYDGPKPISFEEQCEKLRLWIPIG